MSPRSRNKVPDPMFWVILNSSAISLAEGLTHRLVAGGERVLTFHIANDRPSIVSLLSAHRTFEEASWGIYVVRPDNTDYAFSLAERLNPSVVVFVAQPGVVFSFPTLGAIRVQLNDEHRTEDELVRELAELVKWTRRHERNVIWAQVMHEASTDPAPTSPV